MALIETKNLKTGDRVGVTDNIRTKIGTVTKVNGHGRVFVAVVYGEDRTVERVFDKHGREVGTGNGVLVTVERAEEIFAAKKSQQRIDNAVTAMKDALDGQRAGTGHYVNIPAELVAELEALAAKIAAL